LTLRLTKDLEQAFHQPLRYTITVLLVVVVLLLPPSVNKRNNSPARRWNSRALNEITLRYVDDTIEEK